MDHFSAVSALCHPHIRPTYTPHTSVMCFTWRRTRVYRALIGRAIRCLCPIHVGKARRELEHLSFPINRTDSQVTSSSAGLTSKFNPSSALEQQVCRRSLHPAPSLSRAYPFLLQSLSLCITAPHRHLGVTVSYSTIRSPACSTRPTPLTVGRAASSRRPRSSNSRRCRRRSGTPGSRSSESSGYS